MKQHAILIVRELRRHGFQSYLAGGCVRDMLLGTEPTDYDVTTDARPNEVMRIFPETYAVGAQFGVVLVPVPKDDGRESVPPEHPHAIEVATFRSDGIYSDGRHPDGVQYSKSPDDVWRLIWTLYICKDIDLAVIEDDALRSNIAASLEKIRESQTVDLAARLWATKVPATRDSEENVPLIEQMHSLGYRDAGRIWYEL